MMSNRRLLLRLLCAVCIVGKWLCNGSQHSPYPTGENSDSPTGDPSTSPASQTLKFLWEASAWSAFVSIGDIIIAKLVFYIIM
jgi:hypothetical protein